MGKYIVTGGLGALGQGVVALLAKRGHDVAVVDYAQGSHDAAKVVVNGCDLTDEAQVQDAFAKAHDVLGGLDGLVNIAGGFVWETMSDGSLASWDRMYAMNVRTAATACSVALPMLGKGGAIVNIGAAGAASPDTGMAPYAASKAGVAALTESLANELRGKGIRVNAVMPTIVDTPTNRADMPDADTSDWVSPASAARVIAFLLSDEARAVTGVGIKLSLGG